MLSGPSSESQENDQDKDGEQVITASRSRVECDSAVIPIAPRL